MILLVRLSLAGPGSHLTRLARLELEMAGARRRRWASVGWKISMLDLGSLDWSDIMYSSWDISGDTVNTTLTHCTRSISRLYIISQTLTLLAIITVNTLLIALNILIGG